MNVEKIKETKERISKTIKRQELKIISEQLSKKVEELKLSKEQKQIAFSDLACLGLKNNDEILVEIAVNCLSKELDLKYEI